jgi:hypothetical protein
VNTKRLADLFRQRAALDLEIAEALEQEDVKKPKKRPALPVESGPSPDTIAKVRRKLRGKGIAA